MFLLYLEQPWGLISTQAGDEKSAVSESPRIHRPADNVSSGTPRASLKYRVPAHDRRGTYPHDTGSHSSNPTLSD
ncbi:hypothetical protein FOVG_16070 [Fusarium oxysporum f. sp. pisi HDV247]|uniref:Uncharacterized protein n=1 Tax=Fusarium oxysporum f. sp. pisi HDV247 TaxID=1080344 RepID=W9NRY1_FUSOX|nr:hypothetical protein FOVG_16070 [Fusarium oxysporum f. sp. pisi HDV247]